jgi:hypothetical protein
VHHRRTDNRIHQSFLGYAASESTYIGNIFLLGDLHKYIHQESASVYKGFVFTHEHDLVRARGVVKIEKGKKLLICSMCNQSFCECCGKEVSVPLYNDEN